ncbi:hypothetical protein NX773_22080 [Massilia solisilvae]|uniref:Uncharacterized protein n=1 Tax=Massilia solisilvae TaxID=1811225 RepID=A0ABT2BQR7_9BURK|nr:hypothetical protein [Massilia solisilvae]MCS0610862.1 hypothetical protein [Massilia solisilvae]
MKKAAAAIAFLACGVTLATEVRPWRFAFQPFSGTYSIYGGDLGDPLPPSEHSKNIAFSVTGQVARKMFDTMAPDLKDACGAEDGKRMRQRAELVCWYDPKYGYECTFGVDLVSGRSISGAIC